MANKGMQYTIHVGLNDATTGVQLYDTEKYISILQIVCQNYHVAFSLQFAQGSYFHEDGRHVDENTLVITLANIEEETAMEIAKDLCSFFHQESVMVSKMPCSVVFVKDNID